MSDYSEDEEFERFDDDDELEEDLDVGSKRGRGNGGSGAEPAIKKKKPARNRFLDIEAAVDEDDEDEDEDGADDLADGFIERNNEAREAARAASEIARRANRDRDRRREASAMDAEATAERLKQVYGHGAYTDYDSMRDGSMYTDSGKIPHASMMPTVNDPSLWMIRCSKGKEKEVVHAIILSFMKRENSDNPMKINTAFCRESLREYIYIEARRINDVTDAIANIPFIFKSVKPELISMNDAIDTVKIPVNISNTNDSVDVELDIGSWVRVKRGTYGGDLAQVINVDESGENITVKLMPRIDYTRSANENMNGNGPSIRDGLDDDDGDEDGNDQANSGKGKRPGPQAYLKNKPPQKLFNPREAHELQTNKTLSDLGNGRYQWGGDKFKNGYLEKPFKLVQLIVNNISPTLDELSMFISTVDGTDKATALSELVSQSSRRSNQLTQGKITAGDRVEVSSGDMIGLMGMVESVDNSAKMATIKPNNRHLARTLTFSLSDLRKKFIVGDHVAVISGRNHLGKSGFVTNVESQIIKLVSDNEHEELTLLAKDLRISAEVSAGTEKTSADGYNINDVVLLDPSLTLVGSSDPSSASNAVGIIIKIEGSHMVQLITQEDEIKSVNSRLISRRRGAAARGPQSALDSNGNTVRIGDFIRETTVTPGNQRPGAGTRQGAIVHLTRNYVFARLSSSALLSGGDASRSGSKGSNDVFAAPLKNVVAVNAAGASTAGAYTAASQGLGSGFAAPMRMAGNSNSNAGRGGGMGVGSIRMTGAMRAAERKLVAQTARITRGPHKGLVGIIKDLSNMIARIELHTNSKIITVEADKVAVVDQTGKAVPIIDMLNAGRSGGGGGGGGINTASMPSSTSYSGNATSSYPSSAGGGSTYTPYTSSTSTSASRYGSSAHNPSAAGSYTGYTGYTGGSSGTYGSTSAGSTTYGSSSSSTGYNAPSSQRSSGGASSSSASKSLYDGAQTPAYRSSASSDYYSTSNKASSGSDIYGTGSKTPAYSNRYDDGGRTPAVHSSSGSNKAGGSSSSQSASASDRWASSSWNMATPSAETPAASGSAVGGHSMVPATPAAGGGYHSSQVAATPRAPGTSTDYRYSADTPAASGWQSASAAATPHSRGPSAPTPAASGRSAGASGYSGVAETPYASGYSSYGSAPTPAASSSYNNQRGASQSSGGRGDGSGGGSGSGGVPGWAMNGVAVRFAPNRTTGRSYRNGMYDGAVGVLISLIHSGTSSPSCRVNINNDVQQVEIGYLNKVEPEKRDRVLMFGESHRGECGTLLGFDGEDAIIKLDNGTTLPGYKPQFIAKYGN
ncbi:hypothetical protein GQ42DRAFT_146744 [Ramicandelaber brevisporus]|nr:hypothetical protein GQ42DRAFT_146744 [Ramicandelaber brevisporus]